MSPGASHNSKTCLVVQATWRLLPSQKVAVKYLTRQSHAWQLHTTASGAADKVPNACILGRSDRVLPHSLYTHKCRLWMHVSAPPCWCAVATEPIHIAHQKPRQLAQSGDRVNRHSVWWAASLILLLWIV